jgi:hypothetical protein
MQKGNMKNPFLPDTETDWQLKSRFMSMYSKGEWGIKIPLDYCLNTVMWWEFNIVEFTFSPFPLRI